MARSFRQEPGGSVPLDQRRRNEALGVLTALCLGCLASPHAEAAEARPAYKSARYDETGRFCGINL